MFQRFKPYVESHFSVVLLLGFLCGLFLPGAEKVPPIIVPIFLAGVIFFGCSKVSMEDVRAIQIKDVFGFYIFRFCLFPFALFYFLSFALPDFRYAGLMIALLPAGVTLPALTSILGGNAALALGATVLTSFLAPLTIPLAFGLVSDFDVHLDLIGIAKSLAMIIFLPVIFYFGIFRRWKVGQKFVRENADFFTVIEFLVVVTVIIASQRDYIMANAEFMVFAVFLGTLAYLGFYAIGWFVFIKQDYSKRLSYAMVSGVTNIALGISLAFLYFPLRETSMLVACEISWIIALSVFQCFLKMRLKYGWT